jgi:hypothetical protein
MDVDPIRPKSMALRVTTQCRYLVNSACRHKPPGFEATAAVPARLTCGAMSPRPSGSVGNAVSKNAGQREARNHSAAC